MYIELTPEQKQLQAELREYFSNLISAEESAEMEKDRGGRMRWARGVKERMDVVREEGCELGRQICVAGDLDRAERWRPDPRRPRGVGAGLWPRRTFSASEEVPPRRARCRSRRAAVWPSEEALEAEAKRSWVRKVSICAYMWAHICAPMRTHAAWFPRAALEAVPGLEAVDVLPFFLLGVFAMARKKIEEMG